jgi:adenylate cyclase
VEYGKRQTSEADAYAIQMYERALELDPDYAQARARLAVHFANRYLNSGRNASDLVGAERESRKAIETAPNLSMAHGARALYLSASDQDAASDEEYEEALRLGPSDVRAHFGYGLALFRRGEFERTAALWEKAAELDPDDPRATNLLPQVYERLGREADAKAAYERLFARVERYLELNPDDLSQVMLGATALLELNQRDRAFEWAGRITESNSDDTLILYNNACFFSMAGEADRAFDALEKAVAAGDRDVAWWRQDSDLDNIRDDPRFEELIARMEADL